MYLNKTGLWIKPYSLDKICHHRSRHYFQYYIIFRSDYFNAFCKGSIF